MNKWKQILIVLVAALLVYPFVPSTAEAQWGVGASYEIRNEAPKHGFGVRIEKSIFNMIPLVDLGIRAHFSNFSEKNQLNYQYQTLSYSYSRTVQDYDYGLTAIGGVSLGLLKPYVGLGLGSNTVNIKRSDLPQTSPLEQSATQSKIFWNALLGAQVNLLPLLHPFVEYRYTNVGKSFFQNLEQQGIPKPSSSNGRLILGVLVRF